MDFSSVLICFYDNVCMNIDNMINCQSIYMVVLSIIYTKHHDQSLCVWPNQCHDVSYDLLFNDWRSGCNIINLFTLFELKYFKQNKVTIYAKLVFFLLPNESVFRENNEAKLSCYLDENFDTYFASFILTRQGVQGFL